MDISKENFSEWYTKVIQEAELADIRYNVKGFLVHMPWAVRTMKKMYSLLEAELERFGHEPVWFPSVIPEPYFKKEEEHAKGFSAEVFWITEGGSESKKLSERLALRPTSETAMYSIFSLWIRGWRDLPLKTYQSCQVWRFEGKATRPFIRGREFYWIEAHDAFATKEEAEKQVFEDMEITEHVIHKEYAIPFFFFKRPEHDKFKGAISTFAADTIMPDGKVIQLPSTHLLGQNFSKAFGIKFIDKDEKEKYVWQTCYGPAIWRIFGALIAIHGDNKGLILPPKIAPFEVMIVPILSKGNEKQVLEKASTIEKLLNKSGISARIDDREEHTPGWKYNYWELRGVPLRIEIGPRDMEKNQVVLVRRDSGKKIEVEEKNLIKSIEESLDDIQASLIKRAEDFFNKHLSQAKEFKELKKILEEKGGLVKVEWCGEKECADYIKAETGGGEIKGTLLGKEEKPRDKCIWCKKKASQVVYVAKAY